MLIFIILLTGCYEQSNTMNKLATVSKSQISPSGKYLLSVLEGYKEVRCHQFEIKEQDTGKVIFRSNDCFRIRDKNFFLWDDGQDIVWVYSGDLGIFYWTKNTSVQWIKYVYVYGEDKGAPKLLKELLKKLLPELK